MTSKEKGNIGLGQAIAFATQNDMVVSLPLNDAQDYDVIFDNGKLLRVQVKYVTGNTIDTRVRGHGYIKENVIDPDYYFITCDLGNYFIPIDFVKGKHTFAINDNYVNFKV